MLTFILLTLLPHPIDLDGISVERARALHGRLVSASFVVQKPTYTLTGRGRTVTVVGAADRDAWAERESGPAHPSVSPDGRLTAPRRSGS